MHEGQPLLDTALVRRPNGTPANAVVADEEQRRVVQATAVREVPEHCQVLVVRPLRSVQEVMRQADLPEEREVRTFGGVHPYRELVYVADEGLVHLEI